MTADLIKLGEKWRLFRNALRVAAEEAYRAEVLNTEMEPTIIGAQGSYATREDWLEDKIDEWLNDDAG